LGELADLSNILGYWVVDVEDNARIIW